MMKTIKKNSHTHITGLLLLLLANYSLKALAPTNVIRPYDVNVTTKKITPEQKWHFTNTLLIGSASNHYAWNENGHKVRDTQLWNADQNALAMVRGYPQGSTLSNIATPDPSAPLRSNQNKTQTYRCCAASNFRKCKQHLQLISVCLELSFSSSSSTVILQ